MADDTQLAEATQPLSFAEFLERMKEPAAADLVRSIKNFIKTFDDRKPDPERDSAFVQSFLTKSEAAFKQHPVWASAPPAHKAQAVEGLEKYLMTKIYHNTFGVSELDRERDEALHVRMRALNFIKPSHLDIPELYRDEKAWILAMKELHKINNYKAPRDKLVCILNCCRVINNLLHVQVRQGEARGADDFLPVLIYVVIHANPPQLASNLEYIQRFRMHARMASESAYFFTQLYSAASFIETVNAESLTIDRDEFMARMMAAGVPDMQFGPNHDGALRTAPSHEKPPAFVPVQPALDPVAALAAAQAAAQATLAETELAAADQPPTGAALPTSAVPLPATPYASTVLPTHSAAIGGGQSVVPDVATHLPMAGPTQYTAPAIPSSGVSALAQQGSANLQSTWAGDAVQSSGRYPTVEELERAGVRFLLEAEGSGRLRHDHRFLYAKAGDLLITDVAELLTAYKELVLRYESLSLAVAHVASSSAAPSAEGQMEQGSLLVPHTAFALPTRSSDNHLLAARAAGDAAALEAAPLETAATPATALALDEASLTAAGAAEKVLKPTTSAGLYDDRLPELPKQAETEASATPENAAEDSAPSMPASAQATGAEAEPAGGSDAEFAQAMALQDDDRFLSLATGEAQADALDVGTPEAGTRSGAFSGAALPLQRVQLPTLQEVNDPVNGQEAHKDAGPMHDTGLAEDSPAELAASGEAAASTAAKAEPEVHTTEGPVAEAAGLHGVASSRAEAAVTGEDNMGDFARRRAEHAAPDQSRMSISSTAATVGDRPSFDVSRLGSWSEEKSEDRNTTGASSAASCEGADRTGSVASAADLIAGQQNPANGAFSEGMTAAKPATSSDADPFYVTDLALKVSTAEAEKPHTGKEEHLTNEKRHEAAAEKDGSAGDAAADELFGGLTVAPTSLI